MSVNDTAWAALAGAAPSVSSSDEGLLRQRFQGSRVLVVDDEPINREMLKMMLDYAGLATDTASDGGQAIAMAWLVHYPVILMDMQMPEVDGLEATRRIREIPGYQRSAIVALTANTSAEARGLCLASGMNDFMAKPFDTGLLFATLLHWLSLGDQSS